MRHLAKIFTLGTLLLFCTTSSWALPYLVNEPPLKSQMYWDINSNGFHFIGYDLDHNGVVDFYAMRTITKAYLSDQTLNIEIKRFPGQLLFYIHNGVNRSYYVVGMKPSLYAIDVDEDGQWDLIYKDPQMDGVNGNETFYDSPSGMFFQNIGNFN